MSERVPLPTIAGGLSGFVSVDLEAGYFPTAATLVGFQPVVTDAPSGGSVSVDLRTATGGGGSGLSATIPDGARVPAAPVTGSIEIAAGTTLYLRVTAESGAAMNLSGQYLVEGESTAFAALTTLSRVKEYRNTTGTDSDTFLAQLIAAVSRKMQNYMRRRIVQESITDEMHDAGGRSDTLQLDGYPVASVSIELDGTAVDSADFAVESNVGHVIYAPSGTPAAWPSGRRHISADYTTGYAQIPDDLVHAATVQVVWEFKRSGHTGSGRLGERSQVIDAGGQATYLIDAWAPDVLPVMSLYRRWEVS